MATGDAPSKFDSHVPSFPPPFLSLWLPVKFLLKWCFPCGLVRQPGFACRVRLPEDSVGKSKKVNKVAPLSAPFSFHSDETAGPSS